MKFCWSTLNVRNLEESIQFYTNLIGLEVVNRFKAGPELEIAFLGSGETKVELICNGQDQEIDAGKDISWGFEVESLEASLAQVKEKGINVDGDPVQPNPHMRYCFIQDPNGMKIQLVEHIQ